MKSNGESSDLVRVHALKPYSEPGMHLRITKCSIADS